MGVVQDLQRARQEYERGDWAAALARLGAADEPALSVDDLRWAATAASLTGQRDRSIACLQRAFEMSTADHPDVAVRCTFDLAMTLFTGGDPSAGTGWLARGQRLAALLPDDALERGYLAFAQMFAHLGAQRFADAAACADEATDAGRRHDDAELTALGVCAQGRIALYAGDVPRGLALLDEAMLEASDRATSALIIGQVYCTCIEGCQEIADYERVARWTATLDGWCGAHPGLVRFIGQRSLHRAQVLRERGAWDDALDEFAAAIEHYRAADSHDAVGQAAAERGDLLRLRGDTAGAAASYRLAAEHGFDPQPGLALLWLQLGDVEPAAAAVRRVLAERPDDVARSRALPGAIDVLVAAGDLDEARRAASDLGRIAAAFGVEALLARAALCSAAVQLASGDPAGALPYLRRARSLANRLHSPYGVASVALRTAESLLALGDDRSADLEIAAARDGFRRLGATPDLRYAEALRRPRHRPGGLTEREVQVLRLVAAGHSNAQIAADLVLSEHTVARHLSNIFVKLAVSSRTAAAAFAFNAGLRGD